jgi:hypothetical protein
MLQTFNHPSTHPKGLIAMRGFHPDPNTELSDPDRARPMLDPHPTRTFHFLQTLTGYPLEFLPGQGKERIIVDGFDLAPEIQAPHPTRELTCSSETGVCIGRSLSRLDRLRSEPDIDFLIERLHAHPPHTGGKSAIPS